MRRKLLIDIEVDEKDNTKCAPTCKFFIWMTYRSAPYVTCDLFHKGIQTLRYDRLSECIKLDGEMNELSDTDKACVQLGCLQAIYFGATMDLDQAICALSLDHPKYEKLARKEGLNEIADEIRRQHRKERG